MKTLAEVKFMILTSEDPTSFDVGFLLKTYIFLFYN